MFKVKVIDSKMGSGKSSKIIDMMNKGGENEKYIYITPYLSEVQRIKEECSNRCFTEPLNKGKGKLDNLHKLILAGRNIASTHSLFRLTNEITIELLKANNYILVLDEVLDIVEQIPTFKNDMDVLLSLDLINIDKETNVVNWNKDKLDFDSKYNDIKTMCKSKNLYMFKETFIIWTFPVSIFQAFDEVYVLTYRFEGQLQCSYFKLYNVEYEKKSVRLIDGEFKFVDYISKEDNESMKKNINIIDDEKLNSIGEKDYSLSKAWFKKAIKNNNLELIKILKNNNYNFFQHKCKGSKTTDNMFSTFKDFKGKVKGKGFTKGFVSLNVKATNIYADKSNLAYGCNIFLNPIIKKFFQSHNVVVNEDEYALSTLIQWMYRSRIRNDEPINIYIPSKRMRNLLKDWLDG